MRNRRGIRERTFAIVERFAGKRQVFRDTLRVEDVFSVVMSPAVYLQVNSGSHVRQMTRLNMYEARPGRKPMFLRKQISIRHYPLDTYEDRLVDALKESQRTYGRIQKSGALFR